MTSEGQRKVGIVMIVVAIALPVATYLGAHMWMVDLSSRNPVPNQGAMLVAYLVLCASVLVALGVLSLGVVMLIRARKLHD